MSGSRTIRQSSAIALASLLSVSVLAVILVNPLASAQEQPSPAESTAAVGPPLVPLDTWPISPGDYWLPQAVDTAAAKESLLTAIAHSLTFLDTPEAVAAYENYAVPGITRDCVRYSLLRFRTLLHTSPSLDAFNQAVRQEFMLYQAAGYDGDGAVHFTGYFEPSFHASRVPTDEYRYPLFRRPVDLDEWPQPHPTRQALEGRDGLGADHSPLDGLELVWLRDRLEAFLVQVQGSARLQLTDGSFMSVGYAGRTEYDYVSIGRELVKDGKIPESELTLEKLLAYFEEHPQDLSVYLPRNNRFVFFRETEGGPPTGTFSVPVTAGRSIATDKRLMPPGAIALITLDWPQRNALGDWQSHPVSRYVLNQDTGGAIQGAGRADIFVGSGDVAGEQAGQINTDGQLFYLLLRPR